MSKQDSTSSAAPDSGMPEAEFYETQVGASLYKLNPDRKTVSQAMLAAGDDDSLEMVLASDYDRLRAYALSLREREGMVMVPREPTHEQTQAAFNFLMDDEKQINATSGWWGTTEDVAKIKGVYNAMLASAPAAGEGKT